MSNRPRKPPEMGGKPPKPTRGRPRKAPRHIEKPLRRWPEPWLSIDSDPPFNVKGLLHQLLRPRPPESVYPTWKPHKLSKAEDSYWTTALRLMRLSKSETNLMEADLARNMLERHLANRPAEYGDFPPLLLRPFPELATHPTRLTKADLRNKNKRTKKERTYVKDLPKNEDSENYRLRACLLYHLWIAGQVGGWLSARQLMRYMDLENYNTFRGQLQFVFAYGYNYESRRIRSLFGPYDRNGSHRKFVIYRLKTVPSRYWLEHAPAAPTSVCTENAVEDFYPQDFERQIKFILETDLEGKPLKPVYMVDLEERPEFKILTVRNVYEGIGNLWASGYPGIRVDTIRE